MTTPGVVRRTGTALPVAPRPPFPSVRPLGERHIMWTAPCPTCGHDATWEVTTVTGTGKTVTCHTGRH